MYNEVILKLTFADVVFQAGIPVVICEKNSAVFSPGERDWNMGLHCKVLSIKMLLDAQFYCRYPATETPSDHF
jgi:hypothetical protein